MLVRRAYSLAKRLGPVLVIAAVHAQRSGNKDIGDSSD